MNKRRLLKLADLLEADAKNKKGIKFDLGTWGYVKDGTKPVSCGTKACAMGLAALSGAFKRHGLSYTLDGGFVDISIGGIHGGFSSGAKLFDISFDESHWLFDPMSYPASARTTGVSGEKLVAKRIRDFVAGKAAP